MLARQTLPPEALHQSFFVLSIVEIGSQEIFAQAGF
jgi:hypothetical protein